MTAVALAALVVGLLALAAAVWALWQVRALQREVAERAKAPSKARESLKQSREAFRDRASRRQGGVR